ncbi:ImmA/IrrE family metallo-endopeptidase [Flectobacillus roseus]|jgi:Zn-dependent peptidase ImmA (M78 family)
MNRKRLKEIEGVALEILSNANVVEAPVDVIKLIEDFFPIKLEEVDLGVDISGVYMTNGESHKIGYSIRNSRQRQRFTIAHELGHHVLKHIRKGAFVDTQQKFFTSLYRDSNSSTGEIQQEREANTFAATLLMPETLLKQEIESIMNDSNFFKLTSTTHNDEDLNENDLIKLLSKKFDVSTQAMGLRLTNLDLVW